MSAISSMGWVSRLGLFAAVGFLTAAANVHAEGWPRWRGPEDDGMAHGDAPTRWSDTTNVKWKVDIPGRGYSSPVLWGDQVFVTTAIPSALPRRGPIGLGSHRRPLSNHRFVLLAPM